MQNQKKIKISDFERSIIVGLLLGDGHLEVSPNGQTFRLKVEHSINQKDYVCWLYGHLSSFIPGEIYQRTKDNKIYVGFRTSYLGNLRFYHHQFYVGKKKRIPPIISKLINPIVLAIWYMNDGSVKSKKHSTYIIHSFGFSKEDLEKVVLVLESKFGIKTKLHLQKGKYYRIYVLSESAREFTRLIKPTVSKIRDMNYKLVTKYA